MYINKKLVQECRGFLEPDFKTDNLEVPVRSLLEKKHSPYQGSS